jgi:hypothetical protein
MRNSTPLDRTSPGLAGMAQVCVESLFRRFRGRPLIAILGRDSSSSKR